MTYMQFTAFVGMTIFIGISAAFIALQCLEDCIKNWRHFRDKMCLIIMPLLTLMEVA